MSEDIYSLFSKIKAEKNVYSPLSAEIDVTYNCPCNCVHCYQENNRLIQGSEMDTQRLFHVIDNLHELGTFECIISGGDPLCRKDIWDILRHLKEKKIRTVLYTSGYFLDEKVCKTIAELKIARVEITLLGSRAEMHDSLACATGAFQKIISSVQFLKANKVSMRLKYMLMHMNYSGLENLEKLETELGEKIDIIPYLWCKQGGYEKEIATMRITEAEMMDFFRKHPFPKKEKSFVNCNAGKYKIAIDPLGNVKPCSAFAANYSIGNVKQESIKDIWFSNQKLLKMRKTFRYPNVECRRCEKSSYCVLCPAIATWGRRLYGEIYPPMCKYAEAAKKVDDEKV